MKKIIKHYPMTDHSHLKFQNIKKNKKNFEKFWSSIINKGSYEMRFLRQHVNNY